MKLSIKCATLILSLLILCIPNIASSFSIPDANNIFNEGERQYPELLSPEGAETKTFNEWIYRYYSNPNLYVGINTDNEVYFLQDGILAYIGSVPAITSLLGISSGSGGCTTIKLPPDGLFVSYRLSDLIDPKTPTIIHDTTFLETTDTLSKQHRVNKIGGLISGEDDIEERGFVEDGMLYLDSVELSIKSQIEIKIQTKYTPAKLAHPFREFCEGQTWVADSVTEETISTNIFPPGFPVPPDLDLTTSETKETTAINGEVESVNENLDIDIGNISTVRYRTSSEEDAGYSITWISIDYGVAVRVETYNASGILNFVMEATDTHL